MMNMLRSHFSSSWLVFFKEGFDEKAPVRKKIKVYHQFRRGNQWKKAEGQIKATLKFCRESDDQISIALAQLHLALFYAEVGEIDQAVQNCEEAYRRFQRQPYLIQRHNEALAAYALGLLYELFLSNRGKALYWYQEALRLLDMARNYWASINRKVEFDLSGWLRDQIEKRKHDVVEYNEKHFQYPRFDVWQAKSQETPFIRPEDHEQRYGYVIDNERVVIGGTLYHARSSIDIKEGIYHFALPVGKREWQLSKSQRGGYVFVRQQWQMDKEKKGVLWEAEGGWVAVNFTRGSDGKVKFDNPAREIIGGDPAGKLKGYIVTLLKPSSSP
jgi:tetratricopeptide (TPR) repeat protein